jgi:hypothetical protein
VASSPSPDGGTWLGLAALGECAQTTITGLTPGNNYLLRFCAANFGTGSLFNGSPATPTVTVGAASITLSIPQVANTWTAYSLPFTATAATMNLVCTHASGSNAYASLDGFNLNGSVCDPVILPVKFDHFDAQFRDCLVQLDWEGPATESAKAFEIQRSADGVLFETLEKVMAEGALAARWVDAQPLEAAYYRIRMYNSSGRMAESNIVPVRGRCKTPTLLVLSNPVINGDVAQLKFNAQGTTLRLTLHDPSGRAVAHHELKTDPGAWHTFAMPLQGLRPGMYVIRTSEGASTRMLLQ